MEEEIFVASSKDGVVKALGLKVPCKLEELHIYVDGVDITRSVQLEEVRIVIRKEVELPLAVQK